MALFGNRSKFLAFDRIVLSAEFSILRGAATARHRQVRPRLDRLR
jgi:hypothetical protein